MHQTYSFPTIVLLAIQLFSSVAEARPADGLSGSVGYDAGNLNQYLDNVLRNARDQFQRANADPLPLPDSDSSFSKKVLFVTVRGGFRTFNGRLRGLSTLHRSGDATMTVASAEVMTVKATLSILNLDVGSDAKAWFGDLNVGFWMSARVSYVRATIEVRVPLTSGSQPKATRLTINDIGQITPGVNKLGPLNWVLEKGGSVFLNALKGVIKDKISGPILNAINQNIGKVKIP